MGSTSLNASDKSRLELSMYKLNALLDYSSILNLEKGSAHLIARFRQIIEEELSINRILYFFRSMDGWEVLLNANCSEEMVAQISVEKLVREYTDTTVVSSIMDPALREIDVVIPMMRNDRPMAFILLGDTNEAKLGLSPIVKHLSFAKTLSSISFAALQNLMLFQEVIREERIRQQLKTAANLQRMLIPTPDQLPVMPGVEIATHYQPFYEIGGDYFDALPLGPDSIGFCIADVSGKGIPAALLMTNFQAHFRAQISESVPLDDLIRRLNRQVNQVTQDDAFITFFVGRYNRRSRLLEYVTAGHNPPLLWREATNSLEELRLGSVGLGMVDSIHRVQVGSLEVSSTSMLLCYTDGLVECRKDGHEVYSVAIMQEAVSKNCPPREVISRINAQVIQEVAEGRREIFDDISIIALRFTPDFCR